MKMTGYNQFELERDDQAFPCPECGGFAERVPCTSEELQEHDCSHGHECCARAFTCAQCGHHFAMQAPAPDVDFND